MFRARRGGKVSGSTSTHPAIKDGVREIATDLSHCPRSLFGAAAIVPPRRIMLDSMRGQQQTSGAAIALVGSTVLGLFARE